MSGCGLTNRTLNIAPCGTVGVPLGCPVAGSTASTPATNGQFNVGFPALSRRPLTPSPTVAAPNAFHVTPASRLTHWEKLKVAVRGKAENVASSRSRLNATGEILGAVSNVPTGRFVCGIATVVAMLQPYADGARMFAAAALAFAILSVRSWYSTFSAPSSSCALAMACFIVWASLAMASAWA